MPNVNVRISEESRRILRELAVKEAEPMHAILDKAIESYRRKRFLDEANTAYTRLKSNPEAWDDELSERELWDHTLRDGIEVE